LIPGENDDFPRPTTSSAPPRAAKRQTDPATQAEESVAQAVVAGVVSDFYFATYGKVIRSHFGSDDGDPALYPAPRILFPISP